MTDIVQDSEEARLVAFLDKIATMDVETIMRLFLQTRDAAAASTRAYDAQQAQLKRIRETCENQLLVKADATGTTGFKVDGVATTFIAEDVKITMADAGQFAAFLNALPPDQDRYGFYEQRVSSRRVTEYMKANGGVAPPGLNLFRQRVMRVRKASDKGEK